MSKPVSTLYFIYQWFIWLPIMWVYTVLTAIFTVLMTYTHLFKPKALAAPARAWSRVLCYAACAKVKVEGKQNIDPNKSYIFVSNHQSAFDIWMIYGWLPTTFCWVMKKELRKIPFVGFACEKLGHIFIDRKSPIEARKSIERAEHQMKKGYSVVIFPEGTRTKTGLVGPFKRGAFNIASDLGLPIVPITISGSYERFKKGSFNMRPGRMKMIIHKPIECSKGMDERTTRQLSVQVRDIVISGLDNQQQTFEK